MKTWLCQSRIQLHYQHGPVTFKTNILTSRQLTLLRNTSDDCANHHQPSVLKQPTPVRDTDERRIHEIEQENGWPQKAHPTAVVAINTMKNPLRCCNHTPKNKPCYTLCHVPHYNYVQICLTASIIAHSGMGYFTCNYVQRSHLK